MSPAGYPPVQCKVSFADIFKSTRTLREEVAAAALRRSVLEANKKKPEEAAPSSVPPKESGPAPPESEKQDTKPTATPAAPNNVLEWTTEQDFQLLKMKAEHSSWKSISASIGKPVFALKARWEGIQPKVKDSKESRKTHEETKPDKPEGSEKPNGPKVSFSEPLTTSNNDGARESDGKVLYLDEAFTLEDVVLLNQIAAKYEEDKWIRVSSRFFDKTGKRLPASILKKHVRTE
ncbi:hypothetical protein LOZ53_004807 [Ophidiomyces ophidiicola]|nr:hypothetical protein LOZ61_005959 [Ophidiomyces ophidiicola]KAI1922396.1 hypothetical protein LOZ60_005724 [Ophidiomyces ophidiicola]KAI1958015.1 hypothetical protein LOZ59_003677 [Ophidiomyces ophidiicola]KAI1976903.1 hypothetical protein LOZ55_003940 [Ophidiomyces ophidiicola]KAI1985074.1 hypothetical protein LOZ54_004309 [Ophidiomyces ophidiicola]